MWGSRTLIFQLLGWRVYNYGIMRYRFLMEYQKQVIIYWPPGQALPLPRTILD